MIEQHVEVRGVSSDTSEETTMNYVVYYTIQSNDEIKNIFESRAFYIGADGSLAYSVGTNTLIYTIKSIHRLSKGK